MEIRGWVRSSLIDFPDRIATVVFLGGCNFRCPMCHNADLVLRPGDLPVIGLEQVLTHIHKRAGLVDGIVITGGEPTLQPGLRDFCRQVREAGVAVKLDTNGYCPKALDELIEQGLLDYVAMDVKAPPDKYPLLTGCADVDPDRIERSFELLRNSGIRNELRTTVVPGLLDLDDIEALAHWIAGASLYVLQQFRGANTLDPTLTGIVPYTGEILSEMAAAARRWVPDVAIRGL